jgi:pSer/pThr/pTyr-binding forkhead associated (FHA) protein
LVFRDRPTVLPAGDHVIGRDAACAVWIDVEGVSRRHASIHVPADPSTGVTVEDLASTNGTFVEGRPIVDRTPLKNGDRLRLGRATLIFREQDEGSAKTRRVRPASPRS